MKVKICGVTTVADALAAADAGADLIGINFWPRTPRHVKPLAARAIAQALPPTVGKVGLFVNEAPGRVQAVVDLVGLDYVQLHGDEPAEMVASFGARAIRAVRLAGEADLTRLDETPEALILVDGPAEHRGGGGVRCDWTLAQAAAARRPIMLAGGLTPDNVAEAIRAVRPFAVDVASGVERAPGRKDAAKMRAFVEAARGAG